MNRKMKRKRIILTATVILLASVILSVTMISLNVKTKVKEMFKLNKTLQEEGYYMADFEFKMVGCAYYLGKGQYYKSVTFLNDYHKKLSSRKGLIKIPKFINKQDEINFYLIFKIQKPEHLSMNLLLIVLTGDFEKYN